jgi:hypothetical protein
MLALLCLAKAQSAAARPITLRLSSFARPKFRISHCRFESMLNSAVRLDWRSAHRAELVSGSLYLNKTLFSGCRSFSGGAVHAQCEFASIFGCIFRNNSANYGVVLASGIESGAINATAFSKNRAVNLGAGLFLDSAVANFTRVFISDSNVTSGTAASVGAVECWGGAQSFGFCVVEKCRSTFAHAAVRVSSVNISSIFESVRFTNNTSRQKGAAVGLFVWRARADFIRCTFIDNSQGGTNGTTVFMDPGDCLVTMKNCVIYGEEARQFNRGKKLNVVDLHHVTFVYDPKKDWWKDTPAMTRTPDCKICPL